MRIYKVTFKHLVSQPTYFVVDEFADLPKLIDKHFQTSAANTIELISTDVVNMWAQ